MIVMIKLMFISINMIRVLLSMDCVFGESFLIYLVGFIFGFIIYVVMMVVFMLLMMMVRICCFFRKFFILIVLDLIWFVGVLDYWKVYGIGKIE